MRLHNGKMNTQVAEFHEKLSTPKRVIAKQAISSAKKPKPKKKSKPTKEEREASEKKRALKRRRRQMTLKKLRATAGNDEDADQDGPESEDDMEVDE
jgi:hypothetical protein